MNKSTQNILDSIGLACLVVSINLTGGAVIMFAWNILAKIIGLNPISIWIGLFISTILIYYKPIFLLISRKLSKLRKLSTKNNK